ncbi:MAG: D-alanine--D-alanine ligase [Planctomycetaceae bacterium]
MRIGLTYDLRSEYLAAGYGEEETAEFDRPDTIEAIESALRDLGHQTDRIGHIRQLVQRLAAGDRWNLVFNICEGLRGPAREAQVPAILDAYDIPYTFADPLVMSVCLHKELTKMIVREHGLATPRSLVVEDIRSLDDHHLSYPLFIKPVGEGTGKGITAASKIDHLEQLIAGCRELLSRFRQPVLVEEFLPGREFTTGLVGTGDNAQVLGTLEIVLLAGAEPEVYSYVNKERCEELVEYRLVRATDDAEVAAAEALALAAWRALDGRDAGRIDLRSDALGQPQFIEANPLAGLHPQHSDLPMIATAVGMPYIELIRRIVNSASRRVSTH